MANALLSFRGKGFFLPAQEKEAGFPTLRLPG